jgi:hypothetical protein
MSSFIWDTSANTNGKYQTRKEKIFPDFSRKYNIEIKKDSRYYRRSREVFTDRVSATKNGKMLTMINENHIKKLN